MRFLSPADSTLRGLTDLEIAVPPDTISVRFFLDDTRLSELTNDYAVATKTLPVWHTVFDADYFPQGTHELRAEASTQRGTVQVSISVRLQGVNTPSGSLNGAWKFASANDLPMGSLEGEHPAAASPAWRRPHMGADCCAGHS